MVSTNVITRTSLLLSWALPPLAMPADVVTTSFNITWTRTTDVDPPPFDIIPFVPNLPQGYLISGLVPDGLYEISVVAIYSPPMFTSSAAMIMQRTLDVGLGESHYTVLYNWRILVNVLIWRFGGFYRILPNLKQKIFR